MSDLPQDLIEEILYRVPVASLRRLRATCKRWYHQALFKDPRFIKQYYDKTARQYHALMLVEFRVCPMSTVLDRLRRNIIVSLDGHRLISPHCNEAVDLSKAFHCDGILVCPFKKNMIVVWNPFSGQTRWIQLQNKHYIGAYALGYDKNELCRSYKILRFVCRYEKLAPDSVEIYEFTSNSWRNLDAIIPDQAYLKSDGHACASLSGNTYWVSWIKKGDNDDYSLLSFDFSTERFQRLCAPFHHQPCRVDTMALSVVREEHLSLFYQSRQTLKVEIWMTDEIHTTFVSWSKFLTLDLVSPSFSNSMSFYIVDEEKKVVVCCVEDGFSDSKLVCIVREGEEYIPELPVYCGRQSVGFRSICHMPKLFGYVPKN